MCAFPVVKCSSRTSYDRINYRHLYLSRNEMKPPSVEQTLPNKPYRTIVKCLQNQHKTRKPLNRAEKKTEED